MSSTQADRQLKPVYSKCSKIKRTLPGWLSFSLTLFTAGLVMISTLTNFAAPAQARLGGELPALNVPAPEFTLSSNSGDGTISLSDYRGKWVVAYFYPKDFTPGCTLEAQRFQRDLPEFIDRNTQVLGISIDSVDTHAEFCDSEGLKFPLLADEDGSVSQAYGAWYSYMSLRQTYIIDPDGILREIYTKVSPSVHSQKVLARLDQLQQAQS
jgi:peroxiredoxin Q/BCP